MHNRLLKVLTPTGAEMLEILNDGHVVLVGTSDGGDGSVDFHYDRFPSSGVSASARSSDGLSFTPVEDSQHIYLNGLALDEGDDYTLSGSTVTYAAGLVVAGDVVEARYAVASPDSSVTTTIVAYEATGWRYLQVDPSDTLDPTGASYDDSAWAEGQAPFSGGGMASDGNTSWDLNTYMWIRRTIPAGSNFTVSGFVEEEAEIYWNGTLIYNSPPNGGSTTLTEWSVAVPSSAVTDGPQVLVVRLMDEITGSFTSTFGDIRVQGSLS